ncbi:hypothetical protein BRC88_01005 [Halobacteriales archaeon QS_4_69_225]|nr:MAG: hypothetical protein BRC88_01005 [Halobacteriales archaeon QS_4_69_225]
MVKSIGAATIAVGLAGCNRDEEDDDEEDDDGGDVNVDGEDRPDGLDDGEAAFGPENRRRAAE